MDKVIIIKYSEIGLKKKNRPFFENLLIDQMKNKTNLKDFKKTYGRIYINVSEMDYKTINQFIERLKKTFGVASVCKAVSVENSIKLIENAAIALMKETAGSKPGSFKVNTKRLNKRFLMSSYEISSHIGDLILKNFPGLAVKMENSDIVLNIEIREKSYLYVEEVKGPGGLPVGSSGKGLLMLSGGIDSPVAGYMMGKRGLKIDAVYFHSPPYVSEEALNKVKAIAEKLLEYFGELLLFIVPFTNVQKAILERGSAKEMTLHIRASMVNIADRIAKLKGYNSIITGESLGQVASQTSENIRFTQSYTSLPIFRPLIGFNKEEIKDAAKMIGTYDLSILPYDDCCTLFTPKHPILRAKYERMRENFSKMELDEEINRALSKVEERFFKLSGIKEIVLKS